MKDERQGPSLLGFLSVVVPVVALSYVIADSLRYEVPEHFKRAVVAVLEARAASYPTSTKSFTTKNAGDTVQAAHINDIQDEIVAIEDALRGTQSHHSKLASTFYFFANGRATAEGAWTAVAHDDANFTGDGVDADWAVASGDQTTFAYTIVGKTMTIAFVISTSDVGSNVAQLRITVPASATATKRMDASVTIQNAGGTPTGGVVTIAAAGTTINIELYGGGNFTATTSDNTSVAGQISFEID